MPTLVNIELPEGSSAARNRTQLDGAARDIAQLLDGPNDSETILFQDESTFLLSRRSRTEMDESPSLLSQVDLTKNAREARPENLTKDFHRKLPGSPMSSNATQVRDKFPNERRKNHVQEDHASIVENQFRREQNKVPSLHPKQDRYEESCKEFVNGSIADFQTKHPGKLRDYRLMTVEEKAKAEERLVDLLSRLGLTKGVSGGNSVVSMRDSQYRNQNPEDCRIHHGRLQHHDPDETVLSISPQNEHEHTISFNQEVAYPMMDDSTRDSRDAIDTTFADKSSPGDFRRHADKSALLLSPEDFRRAADKSALLLSAGDFRQGSLHRQQSMQQRDSSIGLQNDQMENDWDEESVEIVRGHQSISSHCNPYHSPEINRPNPHKRLASSSGKRGADMARQRLSQESTPPLVDPRSDSDEEIDLSSHMHRLSMSPPNLFEASQSPIQPRLTYGSSEDEAEGKRENDRQRSYIPARSHPSSRESDATNDTIESATYRKFDQDSKKFKRRAMREIPVNVKMVEGATFHLEKLDVARTKSGRAEKGKRSHVSRNMSFPDPLVSYSKRSKKILRDIFGWVNESEERLRGDADAPPGSFIIFNLTIRKVVDLTLKILLKDPTPSVLCNGMDSTHLRGQTIIVVRTKDDLSNWETALREGTGCSVINHAKLSLSERVRGSTAEKATRYDVVLTTYDALKSPDVAIPVDESGHAIVSLPVSSDGWYSKSCTNNDAPRKCKQLSALHQIEFKRIVFTDILGRKSFLVKYGTARAAAALALRGNSRLAFFCRSTEETMISGLAALRKSDRRAIPSILTLLRLESLDQNEQELLDEHSYDPEGG